MTKQVNNTKAYNSATSTDAPRPSKRNITERFADLYVDGVGSVYREEHQMCGECAATTCMLYRVANNPVDVTTPSLAAAPTRTRGNTH